MEYDLVYDTTLYDLVVFGTPDLKTVIHNMMPIFLMKSSSTPSNNQDEYVDLLVDSRKIVNP